MYRQPYPYPLRVYQQQIIRQIQPFYQNQVQQIYPQSLYQPFNGLQIPTVTQFPQPVIANQTFQSPQKKFQSPSRGFASPPRNNLMQSQQNSQSQQNPLLQSPSRRGCYSYEQVMERIKNANLQQQQQNQQCIPQSKLQFKNNNVSSNELKQVTNKQDKQHFPKETKIEQKKEDQILPDVKKGNVEDLEELALQYEDGYIYRGQGYSPQIRQGFGMLTDNEGREIYAGYWKQNFYEGQGRLQNLQAEQIHGGFDCNNMTTIGNGWVSYEGQFVGGKMQGQGQLILSNGEKYVGEFDDGMINGDGEFTTFQNEVIKGNWDQGFMVQIIEE